MKFTLKFIFYCLRWNSPSIRFFKRWNSPCINGAKLIFILTGETHPLSYELKFASLQEVNSPSFWCGVKFGLHLADWNLPFILWGEIRSKNHDVKFTEVNLALLTYLIFQGFQLQFEVLECTFWMKITVLYAFLEWNKSCFWFGCN